MPASQRFLAPLLLLILALPLAMMAMAAGLGLQPSSLWGWAGLSLLFLVIPGLVLAIRGLSLAPKPGQPVDVRRFERQGRSILLALAFVIGAVALLVAAAISPVVALFIVGVVALWVLLWTPPLLRRVISQASVLIQRDPAEVFAFVADSQNAPLYMAAAESVEKITSGPIGPGTRFRIHARLTPSTTWEAIEEIGDYEPNNRLTSRVISTFTPNFDVLTTTPADGGTLLSHRFESEVSFNLALIGAAFRIPTAKRQMLATRQAGWMKLKQILEHELPKT
jgi:Polyketide cyclase / dehydrase and lipid transport